MIILIWLFIGLHYPSTLGQNKTKEMIDFVFQSF